MIVYFSSVTNNTHRFVENLGLPASRISLNSNELLVVDQEFILVTPTYGAAGKGFVPKQVAKFLNKETNRQKLRGVIASGNLNFGEDFCMAGKLISAKCNVPLLYLFELMGTPDDVQKVKEGIDQFWTQSTKTLTQS